MTDVCGGEQGAAPFLPAANRAAADLLADAGILNTEQKGRFQHNTLPLQ